MNNFFFILVVPIFLLNCNPTNKIVEQSKISHDNVNEKVYFSDKFVDYEARSLKYSKLTDSLAIKDQLKEMNSSKVAFIKELSIFQKYSMNFINPYNDSITVVFSFPRRLCLPKQEFINYIDNFSNSMQYIIIQNRNVLIDSIYTSHETRIIPPIDCKEQEKFIQIPNKLN